MAPGGEAKPGASRSGQTDELRAQLGVPLQQQSHCLQPLPAHLEVSAQLQGDADVEHHRGRRQQGKDQGHNGGGTALRLAVHVQDLGQGREEAVHGPARGDVAQVGTSSQLPPSWREALLGPSPALPIL